MTTAVDIPPLEAARQIAPRVREQAERIEADRTVPTDLVEEIRSAGLFDLMLPASLGGAEADPRTLCSVVEEMTHADASTGWTVMVGQGSGYLAWLDPDVAARIVADHPSPIVAGSMAPSGRAVPRGDHPDGPAVELSGRWRYNSGCAIADLLIGGYADTSAADRDGSPAVRFVLFPRSAAVVHDTWRVAGLRGTGSHDVEVTGLAVPVEHTFDPFGPARQPGPLYRLPYMTYLMVAMAGFPLGAARRILDEYRDTVLVKRNTERRLLAETPVVQADLAGCEAAVRAARVSVHDAVDRVWDEAAAGTPSLASRARLTGAVQHAMRTAVEVADLALRTCGASQLYHRAPLQRYFRDVRAAAQHIAFGLVARRRVGAALLDLPVPADLV